MPHYTPTSPTVSVLMAVHDAEASVRRAVESVQNQTLRNLELVVVDAGSADGSARWLESAAERDMRVQLVRAGSCNRQEALDLALERAAGTYVAVVDADAWIAPSFVADLVELAEARSLELAMGGLSLALSVGGARPSEVDAEAEGVVFPTQHDFRAGAWQLFASGQLLPASGKLFRRDRLSDLGARFSAPVAGDHALVIEYLRDVERVGVLPGASYHVARSLEAGPRDAAALEGYRRLEAEHEALLGLYRHWGLEGDAASMEMLQSRYVELLARCVEAVCGWGSRTSAPDQRRIVGKMIETDHAQLAASVARPRDNGTRSLIAPIRSHNVALVCVQARLVSLLRRGAVGVPVDAFV